ncbi:hypothetical protein ACP4OV_005521 [Aristida adscensionis]
MARTSSSFPIINMALLGGEQRPAAIRMLRDACDNWGSFRHILSHGIPTELMDEVDRLTKDHYKRVSEPRFLEFALQGRRSRTAATRQA